MWRGSTAIGLACAVSLTITPMSGAQARADTTPPVISSVDCFCLSAYEYTSATFRTVAHDEESGIATLVWTFSDGGTAAGPTVSHQLSEAGPLVATVTATDGAGNVSSASNVFQVLDNPYPPEPAYTEPLLRRVRIDPSTISLRGVTTGVARRARLSFRLDDEWGPSRISVVLRGVRTGATARMVVKEVREGDRHLVLRARSLANLLPDRYRVIVRATNTYGSETVTKWMRVVH